MTRDPTPKVPPEVMRYGAPMGRRDEGSPTAELVGKVSLFVVPINSGGYDRGGAYWGIGQPLWCAQALDANGEEITRFFRAPDRAAAKASITAEFPNAVFYR